MGSPSPLVTDLEGEMDFEQREALRERNRRRAYNCPHCGSPSVRELSDQEKQNRADTFAGVRYRECSGCGHVWTVRSRQGR